MRFRAAWRCSALTALLCFTAPPSSSHAIDPIIKTPSKPSTSKPTSSQADASDSPQVEIYIPSVQALTEAVKRSHTAKIYAALSGLLALPENETGEDFDAAALFDLLKQIGVWPDTSISLTTYTQDREGRPRWAVRVDWPMAVLLDQLGKLLAMPAREKVIKNIQLRKTEAGQWRLELPDQVLAEFKAGEGGCLILSAADLTPPTKLFGQKASGDGESKTQKSLVYCRLNLEAGDEKERRRSAFGGLSAFSDIRYAGSLTADGQWRERLNVRWNPLLGMALKGSLKQVDEPFEIPYGAYAAAAFNFAMPGLADNIVDLPVGTLGPKVGTTVGVAALPGGGFLPIPDVCFLFHCRDPDRMSKAVRKAIQKDTAKRVEDDKPAQWHQQKIDEQQVFWLDQSADRTGGFLPVSFRTVVFVESEKGAGADDSALLVVIETPTWPEDAVRRWKELKSRSTSFSKLPTTDASSWEAMINWKAVYGLAEPLLSMIGSMAEKPAVLPSADDLGVALSNSSIQLKIQYAGLDVRHTGPIPLGAAYVPMVTAFSLSATGDLDSEAQRERIACRNLRVLHYHAKLFRKDFGRWPATVAELDGYVDFASHPLLLTLRPRDSGFAVGLVSAFTRRGQMIRREAGEQVIDDALYVIEGVEDDWRLAFRDDQFKDYRTIYIDAEGVIHRVAKKVSETTKTSKLD